MRQTKNSGNTYWSNILYKQSSGQEGTVPTVTTDDLTMGFSANATAEGTVVNAGSSDVITYGFVWATHDNPTIDDNVAEDGNGPFTGAFSKMVVSLPFFETVYFAAYATNSSGTGYGEVLSGEVEICFAAGTKISLASGKKKNIERISYEDNLLVWNFDEQKYAHSKPVWILKPFKSRHYGLLKFSNGSELKTVADGRGHRIFNLDEGKFTFSMNEDTPIGTRTIDNKSQIIRVISKEVIKENTDFHNVITHTHFNVFANNILTSTGLNNLYPIKNMKFVKDHRTWNSDFADFPEEIVSGLRLNEQPLNYPQIQEKLTRMLARKKASTTNAVLAFA